MIDEKIAGEILAYQSLTTKKSGVVKSHCITHEVDVIAEKTRIIENKQKTKKKIVREVRQLFCFQ